MLVISLFDWVIALQRFLYPTFVIVLKLVKSFDGVLAGLIVNNLVMNGAKEN
jgi:hypothetical protein